MSKVILFFIAGAIPTDAERAAAEKVGTARFRNAKLATNDPIEKCDAVAGLVPESYKDVKGIEVLTVEDDKKSEGGKQPNGKK